MDRSALVSKVVFAILIVVVLGQIGFYLYTNKKISTAVNRIFVPSVKTPKLTDRQTILKVLDNKVPSLNFTDLSSYFFGAQTEPCSITKNCFEYYNNKDEWHAYTYNDKPLPAVPTKENYFVIRVSMRAIPDGAGITLMPYPASALHYDPQRIFIGLDNNNTLLTVEIKSDETGTAYTVIDEQFDVLFPITTLYIVLDRQGKYLAISDDLFIRFSKYIDIDAASGGAFPRGLFPEGKAYLGFGAGTHSYLFIPEILYATF